MQALRIVALGLLAAVAYGIIHDQITARVCVEYFTVAHPPVFPTESPTLLGLGWGALATWWVGLPLGVLLAAGARIGSWPRLDAAYLLRPALLLLGIVGSAALLAGTLGYVLTLRGTTPMIAWYAQLIPPDRYAVFMADAWAHSASYAGGALGGLALVVWTIRRRRGLARGAV